MVLNTVALTLQFISFNFDLDILAYGFVDFEDRRDAEVFIKILFDTQNLLLAFLYSSFYHQKA